MSINLRRKVAKTAIVIVAGFAAFAAGALVVNAATTGQQSAKKKKRGKPQANFRIRAQITRQLQPGVKVPIKISLANNRSKALWIKRLRVMIAIDKAHMEAGCSVARDYRVEQLRKKFFPYKLSKKPKAKKTKGKKRKAKTRWKPISAKKRQGKPTLSMLALPNVNQDACKGATLTMSFKTVASTTKPKTRKASKQ